MSLDDAIAAVQKSVPECVAVGFVDIRTGTLVGARTVGSTPREVVDLVAAATGDLFHGASVTAIEQAFARTRGPEDDHRPGVQEVIVLSDDLIYVFLRSKNNEDMVLVTVTRANANIGTVLSRTRVALPLVESPA